MILFSSAATYGNCTSLISANIGDNGRLSDSASVTPDQKFLTEFFVDFPQMIFNEIVKKFVKRPSHFQ